MNYREKVIGYASMLRGHAPDMDEVFDLLHEKKVQSNSEDTALEFWTEVTGRLHRNSLYKEIAEMEHIERYNSSNIDRFPDVGTLIESPNILKWISYLDNFQDEIDWLLEYQRDNGVRQVTSERQSLDATMGSLRFYNDMLSKNLPLSELFKTIPLMTWSIDNLLVTNQLHSDFVPFLKDTFVPLLRAHRKAVLEFIDLVKNEEQYLEGERREKTLMKADVFTRQYKGVDITVTIPPSADQFEEGADPYVCSLSATILNYGTHDVSLLPRYETVKRAWHFTPFSNLYRLRMHVDEIGVETEYESSYIPVIPPKVLKNLADTLYTHLKIYSEENLIKSALIFTKDLIAESRDSESKVFYEHKFLQHLEILNSEMEAMVTKGLVGVQAVRIAMEDIIELAKENGIYYDPTK